MLQTPPCSLQCSQDGTRCSLMRWAWTRSAATKIMMVQFLTQPPLQRGQYFVDRDPTHFPTILNFLRVCCTLVHQCDLYNCCCCPPVYTNPSVQDQTFNYPGDNPDYRYLLEVRAEADFYGLVKLTEAVDTFPVGH